jgi:hypothetical protein
MNIRTSQPDGADGHCRASARLEPGQAAVERMLIDDAQGLAAAAEHPARRLSAHRGVGGGPAIRSGDIHRVNTSPVAAGVNADHSGEMPDSLTPQSLTATLDDTARTLADAPTTTAIYEALALAWRAAAAVTSPASAVTELHWMRLTETLSSAWMHLAALGEPPSQLAAPPTAPERPALEDTARLWRSVADLVLAAAVALRKLADAIDHRDADTGR